MKNHAKCLQKVNKMRQQLEKCGMKNGFTDEKTVHISKELDLIITKCTKQQIERLHN